MAKRTAELARGMEGGSLGKSAQLVHQWMRSCVRREQATCTSLTPVFIGQLRGIKRSSWSHIFRLLAHCLQSMYIVTSRRNVRGCRLVHVRIPARWLEASACSSQLCARDRRSCSTWRSWASRRQKAIRSLRRSRVSVRWGRHTRSECRLPGLRKLPLRRIRCDGRKVCRMP